MAGGLGWGIRGQYGHETGAMMAGLLTGLALLCLWGRHWASWPAARAVALMTIAIGFGGSETYAQTIGLTHDAPLVGNWGALGWGLLGLAIKGGLWIGFAGAFLGLGLGGVRYRPLEMLGIFAGLVVVYVLGVWLFNEPFQPAGKILPKIYFSDDWRWEPEALLKPRRERWGGLLLALLALIGYLGWVRRDRLARNLAGWAMLGGAIGFPLGQCVQAFHAWNRDLFQTGWLARVDPVINWWNMMETTFGLVFGGVLGLGLWINRARLVEPPFAVGEPPMKPVAEYGLVVLYVALLLSWEFFPVPFLDPLAEPGIPMGLIPAVALVAGRRWPYWVTLPLTAIPIAGKTLRNLCYEGHHVGIVTGWLLFVVLPLAVMIWAGERLQRSRDPSAGRFLRLGLLINVWLYFGLNFAFFRWPWPWQTWTNRTPNAVIYLVCALALTWLAWRESPGHTGSRRVSPAREPRLP